MVRSRVVRYRPLAERWPAPICSVVRRVEIPQRRARLTQSAFPLAGTFVKYSRQLESVPSKQESLASIVRPSQGLTAPGEILERRLRLD